MAAQPEDKELLIKGAHQFALGVLRFVEGVDHGEVTEQLGKYILSVHAGTNEEQE